LELFTEFEERHRSAVLPPLYRPTRVGGAPCGTSFMAHHRAARCAPGHGLSAILIAAITFSYEAE